MMLSPWWCLLLAVAAVGGAGMWLAARRVSREVSATQRSAAALARLRPEVAALRAEIAAVGRSRPGVDDLTDR